MAYSPGFIKRQLKEIQDAANPNFGAGAVEGDIWSWDAWIAGPAGTPYEGGVFKLRIRFPPHYPLTAPHVGFTTRVFHPNIDRMGNVSIAVLRGRWIASLTVYKILETLWDMLKNPRVDEATNEAVRFMYTTDYKQFECVAKTYTTMYG